MVPLKFPGFNPKMLTDTRTIPLSPVPEERPFMGLRLSQAASSLTDQVRLPVPEFQMLSVWLAGLDPPWVALKLMLAGVWAMVEAEPVCWGRTVRLTGTDRGLLVAPGADMVMVATWLPALTPVTFTVMRTVSESACPVEDPLIGLRVSQVASSLTVQARSPIPEFQMIRFWAGGLAPPWEAVKPMLAGLLAMVAVVAVALGRRIRFTGIVRGVLAEPGAEMVIVVLWFPAFI